MKKSKYVALGMLTILLSIGMFTPSTFAQTKVAEWTFEDGSGANVYDSVGSSNCTIGGAVNWVEGKYGGGLEFDEGTTYLNCTNSSDLNVAGAWAFEYWINTTTDTYSVAGKGYAFGDGFYAFGVFHEGDVERIIVSNDTDDKTSEGIIEGVNNGSWNHVVAMKNSTHLVTYINGVADSTSELTWDGFDSYHIDNIYPLVIGYDDATPVSNWLGGRLDNVRFWSGELSPNQIENLFLYDQLTEPCVPNFTLNSSVEQCHNSTNTATNDTYYDLNMCDVGNLTYSIISGYNTLGYTLISQSDQCNGDTILRTSYSYNDSSSCGYTINNYTDTGCGAGNSCYNDECRGAIVGTLDDVGAGLGSLFSEMGEPLMILMVLLSLGVAVGYIFSSVGRRVGAKV